MPDTAEPLAAAQREADDFRAGIADLRRENATLRNTLDARRDTIATLLHLLQDAESVGPERGAVSFLPRGGSHGPGHA